MSLSASFEIRRLSNASNFLLFLRVLISTERKLCKMSAKKGRSEVTERVETRNKWQRESMRFKIDETTSKNR